MADPKEAAQQIEAFREKHEAVKAKLIQALPQIFSCPVDDIETFSFDLDAGTQSGIFVSGGIRYQYKIGHGRKSLELAES
jgi:hypothetical protein